ncbi:hypothetical protein GQ55_2G020600 [Panicum hallii var. hallii]|uniref:Uncharacterized protein n=1 Tax=Panicum hallii var. hallii TaxID=1504633 RepID=A0A2T7EKJ7_9POAL|nr:hypothetical protein GQ55_2G020600 [Panicum hallii var. hallii]
MATTSKSDQSLALLMPDVCHQASTSLVLRLARCADLLLHLICQEVSSSIAPFNDKSCLNIRLLIKITLETFIR